MFQISNKFIDGCINVALYVIIIVVVGGIVIREFLSLLGDKPHYHE